MNKNRFSFIIALLMAMFAGQVFAGGGLDAGTTALTTIKHGSLRSRVWAHWSTCSITL